MKQDISNLRANIGGLEEAKFEILTDEEKERGYKVSNLRLLKNFEPPDEVESDELIKAWRKEL